MYEIFMLLLNIVMLMALPALVVLVLGLLWDSKTIYPWEAGLMYVNGRFQRVLKPGRHIYISPIWLFRGLGRKVDVVTINLNDREIRSRLVDVTGADRLPFKVSATLLYQVVDPQPYYEQARQTHLEERLHAILPLIVAPYHISEVFERREEINQRLLEALRNVVPEVEISSALIGAIEIPPDISDLLTVVERARLEGLASVERAKSEDAALAASLDAARKLQQHPELMDLKLLQALSGAKVKASVNIDRALPPANDETGPDRAADES